MNKLLSAQGSSKNGSVEATEDPELTHSVQQVCQQASALVLAVDVQRLQKEGKRVIAIAFVFLLLVGWIPIQFWNLTGLCYMAWCSLALLVRLSWY